MRSRNQEPYRLASLARDVMFDDSKPFRTALNMVAFIYLAWHMPATMMAFEFSSWRGAFDLSCVVHCNAAFSKLRVLVRLGRAVHGEDRRGALHAVKPIAIVEKNPVGSVQL